MTAVFERAHGRARYALELGRLSWAAPRALALAVGALALSAALGSRVPSPILGVLVMATVCVAGAISRQALHGAALGLVVSSAPMVLAAALADSAHLCGATVCVSLCSVACAVSGVLGGIALVVLAGSARRFASHLVFGAAAAGALHVAIGCPMSGHGQLLGLVIGVALGAPLSWVARRSRVAVR